MELSRLEERAEQSTRSSMRFSERSMQVRKRFRLPERTSRVGEFSLGVQSVVVEEASLSSVQLPP